MLIELYRTQCHKFSVTICVATTWVTGVPPDVDPHLIAQLGCDVSPVSFSDFDSPVGFRDVNFEDDSRDLEPSAKKTLAERSCFPGRYYFKSPFGKSTARGAPATRF